MADEADLAGNEHHRAMRFCRQERRGSACQVEACRQVHIDDACPVGAVSVDRCQQPRSTRPGGSRWDPHPWMDEPEDEPEDDGWLDAWKKAVYSPWPSKRKNLGSVDQM